MNRLLELSQSIQLVISKNFYLSIDTKTELLQAKKIWKKMKYILVIDRV